MASLVVICSSALILAPLLAFLLVKFVPSRKKVKRVPDGQMGWPFIGETPAFLKPHKSNSMGTFLQDHCNRYGKVFKSHLFGSPAIVSCDLELNMFILQNEGRLFRASYPKQMHGILGENCLLVVSGDHHLRQRSFVVAFMAASKSSPSFLHIVENLTTSLMESWRQLKQVSFNEEMRKFTLNLMLLSLLSIKPEEPSALQFYQDFTTYMKGFISLPLNFPGSPFAKAVKARARMSSIVKGIIDSREKRGIHTKVDFLDEILSSERRPSDEEIVSVVLDILLGGHETTATLICLIIYFVGNSPRVYKHLKEEHEAIRKSKEEGRPLDSEDYEKMMFTRNVIHETARCGNVVKFLHRKALQDVKYKDYVIPAGWMVFPILSAPNFDPLIHENPCEFDPWRWNDEARIRKVTPFGGGPRLCPGKEVAKLETAFFLHHFVLNYSWRMNEDEFPMAYPYVEFTKGFQLEIEPLLTTRIG